jgi:hypothetical protein
MSDEERIVELPERPPPPETSSGASSGDPNSTSKPRQQKSKTSSPSESPLREEEDLFQRFHIIREITTIKGRPQSKLQQMAGKAVEKGDVIGLKALLERSREHDDDTYLVTAGRKNLQLEAFPHPHCSR